jgi:CP family cyanate transporter-like MFS transporter
VEKLPRLAGRRIWFLQLCCASGGTLKPRLLFRKAVEVASEPARGKFLTSATTPLLVGLLLVALNLRPAISSVPPVLETIRQDLGLGRAFLGLLTTIPVLCMSIFALMAPKISGRIGAERAVLWSVVLIGVAVAGRLAAGQPGVLFITTLVAGVGIAVAQSLLPAVVKGWFPYRAALVTGLYTVGITGGLALAALATVPIERLLGDFWPGALAIWSLLAAVAVVFWLPLASRSRSSPQPEGLHERRRLPWRSGRAWSVALFFGAESCLFFSSLTWIAPLYVDQGLDEGRAGLLLAVFALVRVPAAFLFPALADRSGDRRPWLALTLILATFGFCAAGLVPLATPWAPWTWVVVLGLGVGGLFPLALTLPLDYSADADEAGQLTAMTFFVGYLLAAVGPVAVGALRDATGGYAVPFVALAALSVGMLVASSRFRPRSAPRF